MKLNEPNTKMKEINIEPHWPSMWRFIQHLKTHEPKAYSKFVKTLGADQLPLIERKAQE